tara:strand:- start:59 stop:541 length:483 start_codon:yes stop_codon:yes gene_type:complete
MNKSYNKIIDILFEAKKLMMEGPGSGDSPTQTGRTVGRAMNKIYKDIPGGTVQVNRQVNRGELKDDEEPFTHERPHDASPGLQGVADLIHIGKKRVQVRRIQDKVAKRQASNFRRKAFQKGKDFNDEDIDKIQKSAKERYTDAYSDARDSGDYRGNPKNN